MKVWELHRDLANSIGDSCQITSTAIPDGVRFKRALRDSYLNRAMLDILLRTMKSIASIPIKQANEILEKLFPSMTEDRTFELTLATSWNTVNLYELTPYEAGKYYLWIYNAYAYSNTDPKPIVPLPIKRGGIAVNSLLNQRNAQKSDPFIYHLYNPGTSGNDVLTIYDATGELDQTYSVNVFYLPYPMDISQYSDHIQNPTGPIQEVNFESMYIPQIITLATTYALADSQDIENIDRYLPLLLGMQGGQ